MMPLVIVAHMLLEQLLRLLPVRKTHVEGPREALRKKNGKAASLGAGSPKFRVGIAIPADARTLCTMAADLRPIIDDIADRADDFLAGASNRSQGRAGIAELITMDFPELNAAEREAVIAGVMRVLEDEDFFGGEFVGDPFSDDEDADKD
jgi:hypothetical protein